MSANLSFVDLAERPHLISENGVPANLRVADDPEGAFERSTEALLGGRRCGRAQPRPV